MTGECLMYGVDVDSRCLSSVQAEEERIQFVIGSQNIKQDNQVCLLSVEGEWQRVGATSFPHPIGEVRALATSPSQSDVLATASSDFRLPHPLHRLNMYRMKDNDPELEELSYLETEHQIHGLQWEPQTSRIGYVHSNTLYVSDVQPGTIEQVASQKAGGQVHSFTFSPHNNGNIAGICIEKDATYVDLRSPGIANRIPEAHSFRCLTMDFNPNMQYVAATGGDDGAVRVWDWRNPTEPIYSIRPHAHWIWQIRFHPVHDQLLLSCGGDGCVVLSCMQSISSEAHSSADTEQDEEDRETEEEEEDEERTAPLDDGELDRVDEHEDSVHSIAWASSDPWTYASLSYDGRVVVSRISREHKYALMQL